MADPNWQFFKPRALPGPGVATIDAAPALEGPARPPPSTAVSARSTNWTYGRPNIPTTARQAFDVEMPTDRSLTSRARELGARVGPGLQKAARFAKGVGTLGAGAEVVGHLGDYQIDDPTVDSSAAGTMRAVKEGDFSGAARSLGKGGLEALMDVGSIAANAADVFVPGDAPVSRAYNKTLRDQFGPQLVDNSGTLPDGGAGRGFVNPPMANSSAPGPTATAPVTTSPARDAQIPLTAGVPASMGRDTGPLGHSQRADKDAGTLGGSLTNYLAGGGNGTPFDPTNGAGGGPNRRLPTDLSPLQQGQVYKTIDPTTGRTVYSGRDVKEGATIRNGEGTATGVLQNNRDGNFIRNGDAPVGAPDGARNTQGATVYNNAGEKVFDSKGPTTISDADNRRGIEERTAVIEARNDQLRKEIDAAEGKGWGGGLIGGLGESWKADIAKRKAEFAADAATRGMSPYDAAQWRLANSGQLQAKEIADAQVANAARTADINSATQQHSTDVGARVSMRGQDMTQQNNLIQRQIALGQRQYDRFKDDRAYGLEREKFDAGQTAANLSQQQAREGALDKKLESRFAQFDGDGKVTPESKASIASYRAGLDRSYARLGVQPHQVHPRVEEQLLTATDLLRAMRENSGVLPWEPSKLKTIDPVDLVGLQVNPKTGDRVITRADSKARGQVIPARFFETEEAHRFTLGGMRGTPTNKYDMLGAQQ